MRFKSNGWKRGLAAVCVATLATGGVAACGEDEEGSGSDEADVSAGLPQGSEPVELDPSEFTTEIDHPYWPMTPGSRWVYRETDTEGTEQKVVVTVTDKTKTIANGVEARVVHDVVTENGEPVEVTDDWYAEDSEGNVWYLGEETAEYENGKVASRSGSFEAGIDGAEAGVVLPADPQVGQRYRQEYYEGEAEDVGEIVKTDAQAEAPFGHYRDVLMTEDENPLEPKVLEFKFYAPDVGPLVAISVSGGSDREELVSYTPGG